MLSIIIFNNIQYQLIRHTLVIHFGGLFIEEMGTVEYEENWQFGILILILYATILYVKWLRTRVLETLKGFTI